MTRWLAFVPFWALTIGTLSLVFVSILAGVFLARRRESRREKEDQERIGTIVGATLGLLAFIMAFTFGMTAARFDARKQALLDEVNAIETTFLRAGLIPEFHREEVRALLREYVDIRVRQPQSPERLREGIEQSEEIQSRLWTVASALGDANLRNPDITGLFIESLNEMFDLQTTRVTLGVYQRVPPAVWGALIGITVLSMVQVGYLFGRTRRIHWGLFLAVSLAFSVVLVLIADLDRSGAGTSGMVRFSQQPMLDLQRRIGAP